MNSWPLLILLIPAAALVALPALCDFWAWVVGRRLVLPEFAPDTPPRIGFLVPAHDEELLIRRCVRSLRGQSYPPEALQIIVIADNCTDSTADTARAEGATVWERRSEELRGKGHALGWALSRPEIAALDAVCIVDADTIVDPDYATQLAKWSPLTGKAIQSYDGMSNEFETWLTRLAGVLTRNRYGIGLPLKQRAGLNVPLTGDGTVLGTALLRERPWQVRTITEGWELYAEYTLAGITIHYEPRAKLYAQETRSLGQSRTQRERWTSGRLAVFRRYGYHILRTPGVGLLQRLDLVAELTNLGPIMRAAVGLAGAATACLLQPPGWATFSVLLSLGVLHPAFHSFLSLLRHPQPGRTIAAFARLPGYALWRIAVGLRAFRLVRRDKWVRTGRHQE